MATQDPIGLVREHTGDALADRIQTEKNKIALRIDSEPMGGGVLLTGLKQSDGTLSDGITFAASATVDVPHALGRPPAGFLVLQSRDSFAQLWRNDDSQDKTFRMQFIRLVNAGGSSARVTLWVF